LAIAEHGLAIAEHNLAIAEHGLAIAETNFNNIYVLNECSNIFSNYIFA
jgi:hypothetical protein